jgi:hypothetical protein
MAASESEIIELSIPLPRSLDTRIYMRLSTKAKAIVLFLTTASQDDASTPTPLGSLVYALPNVSIWPKKHCLTPSLIMDTAAGSGAASINNTVLGRSHTGVYNSLSKVASPKDSTPSVRHQLDQFRQCRHGRDDRGGDGGFQGHCQSHSGEAAAGTEAGQRRCVHLKGIYQAKMSRRLRISGPVIQKSLEMGRFTAAE